MQSEQCDDGLLLGEAPAQTGVAEDALPQRPTDAEVGQVDEAIPFRVDPGDVDDDPAEPVGPERAGLEELAQTVGRADGDRERVGLELGDVFRELQMTREQLGDASRGGSRVDDQRLELPAAKSGSARPVRSRIGEG